MNVIWSFELGQIWVSYNNGQRIPIWTASPSIGHLVDLANVSPDLSALLLQAALGRSSVEWQTLAGPQIEWAPCTSREGF